MTVVIGIVVIVVGLALLSPVGARRSAGYNRRNPPDGQGGFRPTSVGGNRVMGAVMAVIGVAIVVVGLT